MLRVLLQYNTAVFLLLSLSGNISTDEPNVIFDSVIIMYDINDITTGYTCAARGELEEAEDSARLMLEIVDRHTAVLHLPLTFTLAEASRRLLKTTAERSGRPASRGVHVDALRVASTALSFGRPRQPAESGGFGAAGIGGWCTFGDDIMAAFCKVGGGGGDGGRHVTKVKRRSFVFVHLQPNDTRVHADDVCFPSLFFWACCCCRRRRRRCCRCCSCSGVILVPMRSLRFFFLAGRN